MIGGGWSQAGLWLAVVASGLYHGVNPAMGWPLAVASGSMERSARALLAALLYLAAGHMLAMFVVMVPFAMLAVLLAWQREIQIGASMLVIGFGAFLLIWRRHPRVLVRIPPSRLALWSFAVAIAHGAGLMLVPIYLGLCRSFDVDQSHQAARALIDANLSMALLVSGVHATAMISGRRTPGLVSLPLPRAQVRVTQLVQSGCDLGLKPHPGRHALIGAQCRGAKSLRDGGPGS